MTGSQEETYPGTRHLWWYSLLMGGLTIFSLGIVGEYIGKIYLETKARPRYIIESIIWKEAETNEQEEKEEVDTE